MVAMVLFLTVGICEAQTPAKVLTAFKQKFPEAKNVKWGKEGKTEYEAEFKLNGANVSSNFNVDGTWLETETSISEAQLPDKVKTAFAAVAIGQKIKEMAKIEKKDGSVSYEIEYQLGVKKLEIIFDENGNLISPKKKK